MPETRPSSTQNPEQYDQLLEIISHAYAMRDCLQSPDSKIPKALRLKRIKLTQELIVMLTDDLVGMQ